MTLRLGVRIGQRSSPSALCVTDSEERRNPDTRRQDQHFLVRHLERLPAGTRFPDLARRVAEVVERLIDRTDTSPTLFLDATGLGQPIVDLVDQHLQRGRVVSVFFTHGDRRNQEDTVITLGKAFLVSELQTLLQTHRLHLPDTPQARTLADYLLDYEIHVEPDANERYGAFSVGHHDDLVTALELAVQTWKSPGRVVHGAHWDW